MGISLRPETEKLIQEQMKRGGYATEDEVVRAALQTLGETSSEPLESLDEETLAAIERAEAQSARGEGRPWEQVKAELKARYLKHGQ